MRETRSTHSFVLAQIDNFDARQGYRRFKPSGLGVTVGNEPTALADFWRTLGGNVAIRFSSKGYRYSFIGVDASGELIGESQMEDFIEHITDLLLLWLSDGVDDTPSTEL
jgi:hypothetical protein